MLHVIDVREVVFGARLLHCVRFGLSVRGCAPIHLGGRRGGVRAISGTLHDVPVAAVASDAVRGVARQHAGQLRSPAAAITGPVPSAVASALAARSCRFEPGVLRRPCAGAALPLPAPAPLRPVFSAVASALKPRSTPVRLLLCGWCAAPALAPRRPYSRDLKVQLPGFDDDADTAGRMGKGGASEGSGGCLWTLCHARRWAGGESPV